MNELGFKIKELRKSKKITQKQLATMVGKSERMIQKYESGEVAPTISTFSQISNALGSTMKELMEEDAHLEVIGEQEITKELEEYFEKYVFTLMMTKNVSKRINNTDMEKMFETCNNYIESYVKMINNSDNE